MQLKRNENGLYLNKFENKDEAEEYMEKCIWQYLYTPYKDKMSIRKICRLAEEKDGVSISRPTLSRELKRRDIKFRNQRDKELIRKPQTYTINKDVLEVLDQYPNKSYIVELGLRIVLDIPCEDLIVFFPKGDKDDLVVIFNYEENKIKALVNGNPSERDSKDIQTLVNLGQSKGMKALIEYMEQFNYKYYGGDAW